VSFTIKIGAPPLLSYTLKMTVLIVLGDSPGHVSVTTAPTVNVDEITVAGTVGTTAGPWKPCRSIWQIRFPTL